MTPDQLPLYFTIAASIGFVSVIINIIAIAYITACHEAMDKQSEELEYWMPNNDE